MLMYLHALPVSKSSRSWKNLLKTCSKLDTNIRLVRRILTTLIKTSGKIAKMYTARRLAINLHQVSQQACVTSSLFSFFISVRPQHANKTDSSSKLVTSSCLALWKHHVNLLLQSFRSVSSDIHHAVL